MIKVSVTIVDAAGITHKDMRRFANTHAIDLFDASLEELCADDIIKSYSIVPEQPALGTYYQWVYCVNSKEWMISSILFRTEDDLRKFFNLNPEDLVQRVGTGIELPIPNGKYHA